jgi:hypothetical protein
MRLKVRVYSLLTVTHIDLMIRHSSDVISYYAWACKGARALKAMGNRLLK